MAVVWVPSMMRDLTGGLDRVHAPGGTVAEVLDALEKAYPGFKDRLLVQGELAPGIMATVDGQRALRGLQQQVAEESEIRFLPTMAGG
jgi:molybdopterin synthase sulfur carrier subunit